MDRLRLQDRGSFVVVTSVLYRTGDREGWEVRRPLLRVTDLVGRFLGPICKTTSIKEFRVSSRLFLFLIYSPYVQPPLFVLFTV